LQVIAAIIALLVIPIWTLMVDRPEQRGYTPPGAQTSGEGKIVRDGAEFDSTGAVLRNRNFWLIALTLSGLFAALIATMRNIMPLALDLGVSHTQGAQLISYLAVAGIPGTLMFGWIADRIDVRMALAAIIGLVMLALACLLGQPSYIRLLIGSVTLGLGAGGVLPIWGSLIARIFGVLNFGRIMGLMRLVLVPFNMMAPPLAGLVYDLTGSYHLVFAIGVAWMGVGLLLIRLIKLSPKAAPALLMPNP